jgi:hypothetical protein
MTLETGTKLFSTHIEETANFSPDHPSGPGAWWIETDIGSVPLGGQLNADGIVPKSAENYVQNHKDVGATIHIEKG